MDSNRQAVVSNSPHSSRGVDINSQNSPVTSLSAFSAGQYRVAKNTNLTNVEGGATPNSPLGAEHYLPGFLSSSNVVRQFSSRLHDPFVASPGFNQKLSPTACAFEPLVSSKGDHNGFSALNGTMGTLASAEYPKSVSHVENSARARDFLNATIASTPSRGGFASNELNADDNSTRYLVVSGIDKTTAPKELREFFTAREFPSLKGLETVQLISDGRVYASFWDIRDAEKAFSKATSQGPDWVVHYCTKAVYFQVLTPTQSFISAYEAQVFVSAECKVPTEKIDNTTLQHMLQELLARFGDMKSYQNINDNDTGVVRIIVEFFDMREAEDALDALSNYKMQGYVLNAFVYEPDCTMTSGDTVYGSRSPSAHHTDLDAAMRQLGLRDRRPSKDSAFVSREGSSPAFSSGFGVRLSPTGRSQLPADEPSPYWNSTPGTPGHRGRGRVEIYSPSCGSSRYFEDYRNSQGTSSLDVHGVIGQERGMLRQPHDYLPTRYPGQARGTPNRIPARQDQDWSGGHHNIVDIERIRRGLDVRTTIMLRNIPNKIDQAMLKEIVDETSTGKYDFMYLRIDFANNCNVGYAFINFEDPYFIIDFVEARAGRRWNRFNSDKVAEVSYATIQGKDCLVQKFRNSSVMLEHPSFRPKIFHTGIGPLAGQEDVFPGPDNPSKMRRSVENAEHVGLFAPRAGQHFRDEQRRRRSQFDRGTRLAEMEEAFEYDNPDHFDDQYYQSSLRYGIYDSGRGNGRRPGRFDPRY